MLTLLTPTALLALLGILVPVAIHLWNRRPGREVAVGSLRWLAAGANRRLRNLKLEQVALLLLRAALLAVLALAVANPAWRQPQPIGRGQVLLSPEAMSSPAMEALRPTIDSLRRRGYALRWLATGFPKMSGAAGGENTPGHRDSARLLAAAGPAVVHWLWARTQQAADVFAGQPLYVVTPGTLQGFQGSHPPLGPGITWQTLPGPAPTAWLQAADLRGDSLHLLVGRSDESQTTFQRHKAAKPSRVGELIRVPGLAPLRYQPRGKGGKLMASVPTRTPNADSAMAIESSPEVIAIYSTPAYAADARYLQAGVRAASAGFRVPPLLKNTSTPPRPGARWLFWLSDEPLPAEWHQAIREGARVWQEAAGPGAPDTARVLAAGSGESGATIFRRSPADAQKPGEAGVSVVWADGLGRAVLSEQVEGKGALYRLHTRLRPDWSNLADDPELPGRLLELLRPAPPEAYASTTSAFDQTLAAHDLRAIDPAQLLVRRQDKTEQMPARTAPAAVRITELRPWLVLVAGLLFFLERLLARRREAAPLPSAT